MTPKKIVFVSPHLDDAVFSAGGLAAAFVAQGHEVTILTCFTKSVVAREGFALACQLDKGLSKDVDYMELRREEDKEACEILGARPVWLDLPEAPHRSYHSAKELFEGIKECDKIQSELFSGLKNIISDYRPDLIFSPMGIGNHVDHLQVCCSVERLRRDFPEIFFFRWYDQPYLFRNPFALAKKPTRFNFKDLKYFEERLINRPQVVFVVTTEASTEQKVNACKAYSTQVNFQFGSSRELEDLLTADPLSGNRLAEFFGI